MIPELRKSFNQNYSDTRYRHLLSRVEERCGASLQFRLAETPIFLEYGLLEEMAKSGADLTYQLLSNAAYLEEARRAIPRGYCVANETAHPHFLTADFALIVDEGGAWAPRLVEIQAFPSVYGFQAELSAAYQEVYELDAALGSFLGGMDEAAYWELLRRTIVGAHPAENVVLMEVDPLRQKTRPDFMITAENLGIAVVDIREIEAAGDKLVYRDGAGRPVPIHRIYNRAIADELIARDIRLKFDLTKPWGVEWAGHPNWYFLVSKFSLPWLTADSANDVVPPATFLSDFLDGEGRRLLEERGVRLPEERGTDTVYEDLLLKPLFSFAGKGIQFAPTRGELERIAPADRGGYLLQQRMDFVRTIETPHGPTQAEIRIFYLWPDGGELTPVLPLIRLGRGKMMGVDHNRNQEWVGASAAFYRRG